MRLLVNYRWFFATILLLLTGAGVPFLQKAIIPNNALSVWFPADDPALQTYQDFHRQFGNDEIIVLAIENTAGIFSHPQLEQIRRLTGRLESLDGISRVYSLTNVRDMAAGQESIRYLPLIPDSIPAHADSLRLLARKTLYSPLIADRLVNAAGTSTLLIIRMKVMADIDTRRDAVIAQVRTVAGQELGASHVHLGGIGVIYAGLNAITRYDFGVFVSISYLVMVIMIWWLYRRFSFVLAALGSILVATLLTLSLYGALGFQVNMITMMLPTLIIVLGIVDVMHILNEYHFVQRHSLTFPDQTSLITQVLTNVWQPCLYTSLTTMAGFMALTSSPLAVLKEFGIFAAAGLALALGCSFVFSACVLYHFPGQPASVRDSRISLILAQYLEHIHRNPRRYWLLIAGITGMAAFGATRVITDTYTIGYLPDDDLVVRDHQFIQKAWGDYFPLEFIIRPAEGKTVKHPEIIRAMKGFVDEATRLPEVRNGYGLHLLYERAFPLVYGPFWETQLESKRSIELVTRRALRQDSTLLAQWVSDDFRTGRITLVGKMMSAGDLEKVLRRLAVLSKVHFGQSATVTPAGYPPLYAQIVGYIMESQKRSFFLAVGLVFGCLLLMLKNFRLALVSVLPSLFPVVLLLGVMGYAGITLDIATATVAAIVIGISVDDTIHFIYHYRHEKQKSVSGFHAQQRTVRHVGRAIVVSSITLFTGYLALLLASVKTVFFFGLLTAIAIAGALFAQLILFPLLLRTFDPESRQHHYSTASAAP